jgi:hypothetical protein
VTYKEFEATKTALEDCSEEDQALLRNCISLFLSLVKDQLNKHNNRYVSTGLFIRSCFCEYQIGTVAARLLLNLDPDPASLGKFKSECHGLEVDLEKFRAFVIARADAQRMQRIRLHDRFVEFESTIEKIADGKDIWSLEEMEEEKHRILSAFAAQPSTTHHVERGVKLGAFARKTGKQEMKVSMHVMASNPFREFTRKEFEEPENEDEDEHPETMSVRVKQLSPRQSIMEMEKRCADLRLQKVEMMKPDIVAYNERRKKVANAISVKDMTYLAERSMEKKFSLLENKEPREIEFRYEKIDGKDLHTEDLKKELQQREDMPAVPKINFTILKRQLIENEKRLLRERNPTADETEIEVMAKVFSPQCPDALFTIE